MGAHITMTPGAGIISLCPETGCLGAETTTLLCPQLWALSPAHAAKKPVKN